MTRKFASIIGFTKALSFGVSLFSALCFATIYLLVPVRTFQKLTGEIGEALLQYQPALMFATFLSAITFYILYKTFHQNLSETSPRFPKLSQYSHVQNGKYLQFVLVILALGIVVRSLCGMFLTPMDWDEQIQSAFLLRENPYYAMDPLAGTVNHPISAVASWLSMQVLGVSKLATRLPSIVFLVAFLVVLMTLMRRHFSILTQVLVLSVLLTNPLFLWYSHSMRGYISMVCLSFAVFVLIYHSAHQGALSPLQRVFLFLLMGGAIFTHDFGVIFCGVLFLTFTFFSYLKRTNFDEVRMKHTAWISNVFIFWLIVGALVSVYRLLHLESEGGWIMADPSSHWLSAEAAGRLFALFGMQFSWQVRVFLLATLAVVWLRYRPIENRQWDMLTLFCVFTIIVLVGMVQFLQASILEGRMLLAFFPVFLLWLGHTLGSIKHQFGKCTGWVFVLAFLNGSALIHPGAHADPLYEYWASHEKFIRGVTGKAKLAPLPCWSFSGEETLKINFMKFYLADRERQGECKDQYHVHIEVDPNEYLNAQGEVLRISKDKKPDFLSDYRLVFTDSMGRELHKLSLGSGTDRVDSFHLN